MAETGACASGHVATVAVANTVVAARGAHVEVGPTVAETAVLPTPNTPFRVVPDTGTRLLAARVTAVDTKVAGRARSPVAVRPADAGVGAGALAPKAGIRCLEAPPPPMVAVTPKTRVRTATGVTVGAVVGRGPSAAPPAAPWPLETTTASGALQAVARRVAGLARPSGAEPGAAEPDGRPVIGAAPLRVAMRAPAAQARPKAVGPKSSPTDTVRAPPVAPAAIPEEETRKPAPARVIVMAETEAPTGATPVATVGWRK